MILKEFDDSFLISQIVSDFVRSERTALIESTRITDEHFKELHRLYLLTLKKPQQRATFQGKYVLICFDENNTHKAGQRHLLVSAKDAKPVKQLIRKHQNHNYLLLHQSRAKKYGIKRTHPIWRNLA